MGQVYPSLLLTRMGAASPFVTLHVDVMAFPICARVIATGQLVAVFDNFLKCLEGLIITQLPVSDVTGQ